MKQKAFLIAPVRNLDYEYKRLIDYQAEYLEQAYKVYYPGRDTNQHQHELDICNDNLKAMKDSDIVLMIWDGKSQGCLFDLGMAFALHKPVQSIIGYMPRMTTSKSFQNLVYEMEEQGMFSGVQPPESHGP